MAVCALCSLGSLARPDRRRASVISIDIGLRGELDPLGRDAPGSFRSSSSMSTRSLSKVVSSRDTASGLERDGHALDELFGHVQLTSRQLGMAVNACRNVRLVNHFIIEEHGLQDEVVIFGWRGPAPGGFGSGSRPARSRTVRCPRAPGEGSHVRLLRRSVRNDSSTRDRTEADPLRHRPQSPRWRSPPLRARAQAAPPAS